MNVWRSTWTSKSERWKRKRAVRGKRLHDTSPKSTGVSEWTSGVEQKGAVMSFAHTPAGPAPVTLACCAYLGGGVRGSSLIQQQQGYSLIIVVSGDMQWS